MCITFFVPFIMTNDDINEIQKQLHQGSVCQFTEKNPNPNYKVSEICRENKSNQVTITSSSFQSSPKE